MSGCCGPSPVITSLPPVPRVDVEGSLMCDVLADGTVVGQALVEAVYDTSSGTRIGTRPVDPVTGADYLVQGTLQPCPPPESCTCETVVLCAFTPVEQPTSDATVTVTASTPGVGAPGSTMGAPFNAPLTDSQAVWDGSSAVLAAGPDDRHTYITGLVDLVPDCGALDPAGSTELTMGVRIHNDGAGAGCGLWGRFTVWANGVDLVGAPASGLGVLSSGTGIAPGATVNPVRTVTVSNADLLAGNVYVELNVQVGADSTFDGTGCTPNDSGVGQAYTVDQFTITAEPVPVTGCLVPAGEPTPFLRHICRTCTGTATVTDTTLDGVTEYDTAGAVVTACGSASATATGRQVIERCGCDQTASGIVRYVELWSVDTGNPDDEPLLLGTWLDGDFTAPYEPVSPVDCPADPGCASPTTPVTSVGLCLADGTPIAVTVVRDCDGAITSEGWLNLTTGSWTAGAVPVGTVACGDSRSIQVSGTFCAVDDTTGDVVGLVLVEYTYDDTGAIADVRLVDAVTGTTYVPPAGVTVTVCPTGTEQPEQDAVVLCHTATDGTVTQFVRDYRRDETGAITAHSDYQLDGTAYTPDPTGTVGVCQTGACQDCETLLLCADDPATITGLNVSSGTLPNGVDWQVKANTTAAPSSANNADGAWWGDVETFPNLAVSPYTFTFSRPSVVEFSVYMAQLNPASEPDDNTMQLPPGLEVVSLPAGFVYDAVTGQVRVNTSQPADPTGANLANPTRAVSARFRTPGPVSSLRTYYYGPRRAIGGAFRTAWVGALEVTPSTQFLRRICRDCDGMVTGITDTLLDGTTLYDPPGEVAVCEPVQLQQAGVDVEQLTLCHTAADGTVTPFIRRYAFDASTGAVTSVLDYQLGGTAFFAPAPGGTIGVCSSSAEPCHNTTTVLLCAAPADSTTEVTPAITDSNVAAIGQTQFQNHPGPYTPLWTGGTLVYPAGAGPAQQHLAATGQLTADVTGCEDAAGTLTVSVRVRNDGPDDGQAWDGALRLFRGTTQIAAHNALEWAPVGWQGTLTVSVPVTAAEVAAGDIRVSVQLETYHLGAKQWTADQFTATLALEGCALTAPVQILRNVVTDCETGEVVTTYDTTLDGEPYDVGTGEVSQCQPVTVPPEPQTCCPPTATVELCDVGTSTLTFEDTTANAPTTAYKTAYPEGGVTYDGLDVNGANLWAGTGTAVFPDKGSFAVQGWQVTAGNITIANPPACGTPDQVTLEATVRATRGGPDSTIGVSGRFGFYNGTAPIGTSSAVAATSVGTSRTLTATATVSYADLLAGTIGIGLALETTENFAHGSWTADQYSLTVTSDGPVDGCGEVVQFLRHYTLDATSGTASHFDTTLDGQPYEAAAPTLCAEGAGAPSGLPLVECGFDPDTAAGEITSGFTDLDEATTRAAFTQTPVPAVGLTEFHTGLSAAFGGTFTIPSWTTTANCSSTTSANAWEAVKLPAITPPDCHDGTVTVRVTFQVGRLAGSAPTSATWLETRLSSLSGGYTQRAYLSSDQTPPLLPATREFTIEATVPVAVAEAGDLYWDLITEIRQNGCKGYQVTATAEYAFGIDGCQTPPAEAVLVKLCEPATGGGGAAGVDVETWPLCILDSTGAVVQQVRAEQVYDAAGVAVGVPRLVDAATGAPATVPADGSVTVCPGGGADACVHCETVILADSAPLELEFTSTAVDATPFTGGAPNAAVDLATSQQAWDQVNTVFSPVAPVANGQRVYAAARIGFDGCPPCGAAGEVNVQICADWHNNGPTDAPGGTARFKVFNGTTEIHSQAYPNPIVTGGAAVFCTLATVSLQDVIDGKITATVDLETVDAAGAQRSWEVRSLRTIVTSEITGCGQQFARTTCRDCEGNVVSVTQTTLTDGETYEPVGDVSVPLPPNPCVSGGGAASGRQLLERCGCDQGPAGLVRYVELWSVDPEGASAPFLVGTYEEGDFTLPYAPINPVDCPSGGGDGGGSAVNTAIRRLTGAGVLDVTSLGVLQSVTVTVLAGAASVTTSDGTADLPAGASLTWSVATDSDSALDALTVATDPGDDVLVTATYKS